MREFLEIDTKKDTDYVDSGGMSLDLDKMRSEEQGAFDESSDLVSDDRVNSELAENQSDFVDLVDPGDIDSDSTVDLKPDPVDLVDPGDIDSDSTVDLKPDVDPVDLVDPGDIDSDSTPDPKTDGVRDLAAEKPQPFSTVPESKVPKETLVAMYAEMRGVMAGIDDNGKFFVRGADNAAPLIEKGSVVKLQELSRSFNGPDAIPMKLSVGDEVVRVTYTGENCSPYFMPKSQFEQFSIYNEDTNTYQINEAEMRDVLALPDNSKLEEVQLFKCKDECQIFVGSIAPAMENGERKNGGGEQLVLLNRQEKLGDPALTVKVEQVKNYEDKP